MPPPERTPRPPSRRAGGAAAAKPAAEAGPAPRPPGLKLQEPALARLLDTVPDRGTFVPTPSVDELHLPYEARMLIGPGITRLSASRASPDVAGPLTALVMQEAGAMRLCDRDPMFRPSAESHDLLARLTRNDPLRGLMTGSSLHFALYAPTMSHHCARPPEHAGIAAAVADGDARRAERQMQRHLQGPESMLSVRRRVFGFTSLQDVFSRLATPRNPNPTTGATPRTRRTRPTLEEPRP
jgi:hypothetical protein